MIRLLAIDVDGHFHGGPAVKPWVAKICGIDEKFGLRREFVQPLNDFRNAKAAWSGNVYGIVARFPLASEHLYEVSRTRGNPSKLRVVREFVELDAATKMQRRPPEEALAIAEGTRDALDAVRFRLPDVRDSQRWVAEVTGIGTPRRLGWVVVDGERRYRLREGRVYEVQEGDDARFVRVVDGEVQRISRQQAIEALLKSAA